MKTLQTVTDGVLVRLGTLLSACLLGYGMKDDHVSLAVPAVLVLVGVAADMITGRVIKALGR